MATKSISLHNIYKDFEQLTIFNNISYTFEQNKSYALVGASGVGKSTLLHMIAGIESPSRGMIRLEKSAFSKAPLQERIQLLQQSIGLVFQQSLLLHELSVLENIMLKQIIHSGIDNDAQQRALSLLADINLQDKADCMPSTLSGGQQQKIALLRAIFNVPQFLLADEPTGNLDETSGKQIIQLLLDYQRKYNMGLIISTHDMNIAKQCDVILKIEHQQLNQYYSP